MQIAKLIPLLCLLLIASGCLTDESATVDAQQEELNKAAATIETEAQPEAPAPGTITARLGDEIVVAGQFVHTGTPVVLWLDPGGYDAYRVERRFAPLDQSSWSAIQETEAGFGSPNRYDQRTARLDPKEQERVRGGAWDLGTLQRTVDQIVMHYDAAGTSRQCFKVLQDVRDLSVHFMVDLDGTIYQTLDVKERARHASGVNNRSIGIEIANIGAYSTNASAPLTEWYQSDASGQVRITLPARFGDGDLRTTNFLARPARPEAITSTVQGELLVQYDFTPEQYTALSHLVAALCAVLPEIKCDVPRDRNGRVPAQRLPAEELVSFQGVLGHYHVTEQKIDPGPAFDWDKVIGGARRLLQVQ
jgi:N-acetylmuramoyl-L-alanine amidase